jgi:hypothetical protein
MGKGRSQQELNMASRVGAEAITCCGGEKLTNEECSVTGCIVVVENPILRAPQIWLLSPSVLSRTPQNYALKLCVDGLALGDKFTMNNAANVKRHDEHGLH